jgi:oligopeptide transport system permease protein
VTAFIIRRLASLVLVLWGAVTLLFFLFFLLPEDPAELIAGGANKKPDEQVVQNIREKYGLDQPIYIQYGKYLGRLVTFDFGTSYRDGKPVTDIVAEKAPASLRLAFWAIAMETIIGVGAGVLAAVRKYSVADTVTTLLAAVLSAIPVFVLAYFMQQVTGVAAQQGNWPQWMHLPVQNIGPDEWFLGVFPASYEQFRYLVQPVIVLASVSTVIVARLARTTMLEVGKMDYVRTARSKGLSERDIIRKHSLRNAMIPVITYIGIDFGTLVGAAILTETVFNWPGLGSKIAQAANGRDLPVLVGLTFVVVLIYGVVNMLVDISYAWFDPRVRLGEPSS